MLIVLHIFILTKFIGWLEEWFPRIAQLGNSAAQVSTTEANADLQMFSAQTGNTQATNKQQLERNHSLWATISQSTHSIFMKAHASPTLYLIWSRSVMSTTTQSHSLHSWNVDNLIKSHSTQEILTTLSCDHSTLTHSGIKAQVKRNKEICTVLVLLH